MFNDKSYSEILDTELDGTTKFRNFGNYIPVNRANVPEGLNFQQRHFQNP